MQKLVFWKLCEKLSNSKKAKGQEGKRVRWFSLGFGDIVPLTKLARLAVGIEVVLGYIMLGGLIAIFATKLARRSA